MNIVSCICHFPFYFPTRVSDCFYIFPISFMSHFPAGLRLPIASLTSTLIQSSLHALSSSFILFFFPRPSQVIILWFSLCRRDVFRLVYFSIPFLYHFLHISIQSKMCIELTRTLHSGFIITADYSSLDVPLLSYVVNFVAPVYAILHQLRMIFLRQFKFQHSFFTFHSPYPLRPLRSTSAGKQIWKYRTILPAFTFLYASTIPGDLLFIHFSLFSYLLKFLSIHLAVTAWSFFLDLSFASRTWNPTCQSRRQNPCPLFCTINLSCLSFLQLSGVCLSTIHLHPIAAF